MNGFDCNIIAEYSRMNLFCETSFSFNPISKKNCEVGNCIGSLFQRTMCILHFLMLSKIKKFLNNNYQCDK